MSFLSKVASLSFGNLIPQVVVFISTPILSRLYSPDQFGVYFYIFSISGILSIIISGAYHHAIYSEIDKKTAGLIAVQCATIIICATVVLQAFVASSYFIFRHNYLIELTLAILAACVLSLGQLYFSILINCSSIKETVSLQVAKSIIMVGFQLIFGLGVDGTFIHLMGGYILSELFIVIVAAIKFKDNVSEYFLLSLKSNFKQIRERKNYLYYYVPSQIIGLTVNFLPLILLRDGGRLDILGVYSLSLRLISSPVNAAANSLKAALWRHFLSKTNKYFFNVLMMYVLCHVVGIVVALCSFYFGPWLVEVLFGPRWSGVNVMLPYVILWQFSSLANVFSSEVLKNNNKQIDVLAVEVISAAIKIFGLIILAQGNDYTFIICGWCVLAYVSNVISSLFSLKLAKNIHNERVVA